MALSTIPPVPRHGRLLFHWLDRLRTWLNLAVNAPEVSYVTYELLNAAPSKPKEGTVAGFDGDGWDLTGTGNKGLAVYLFGSWRIITSQAPPP